MSWPRGARGNKNFALVRLNSQRDKRARHGKVHTRGQRSLPAAIATTVADLSVTDREATTLGVPVGAAFTARQAPR